MAKISQLPLVTEPDGSETFVVLKDGMAQRVPGAALIGAAGEVSLEQVLTVGSDADIATTKVGALVGSGNPSSNDRISLPRLPGRSCCRPSPYVIGFAFITALAFSKSSASTAADAMRRSAGAVSRVAGSARRGAGAPLLGATVRWGFTSA
jgi:hypothetical protein